jgi:hypothetical protein
VINSSTAAARMANTIPISRVIISNHPQYVFVSEPNYVSE